MGFFDWIKNLLTNNKKTARIITRDLSKIFGETDQLEVALLESTTPLADKAITINVNDKTYSKKTDNDGIARLNVNLPVGEYEAKFEFVDDDYNYVNAFSKIVINPVLVTQDMKMAERDGSQFIAITTSKNGVRLSGVPVTFNINGKDYTRTSDFVGEAKININLPKGDYDIKTTSLEVSEMNVIHIDEKPKEWKEQTLVKHSVMVQVINVLSMMMLAV